MTIYYSAESEDRKQYIEESNIDYMELRPKHLIIKLKTNNTIVINMRFIKRFEFDDKSNTNIGGYDM